MNGSSFSKLRRLAHPGWILLALIPLTQLLKDGYYPFSHYPMYSNIDEEATYLYLADGADVPLATGRMLGLSAARVNKIFHTKLRKECQARRVRISTAPPEVLNAAAVQFIEDVRKLDADRGESRLPEKIKVVRVVIELKNRHLTQTPTVVGEG